MKNELLERLTKALVLIVLIFLIGTIGFHTLLDLKVIDAFYLTVITLSTVGYGDISPHSSMPPDGNPYVIKIFASLLILVGMGALLYAVGVVTEYIVVGELGKQRKRKRMQHLISTLRNHYIICGAGETGTYISDEMEKTSRKYVVIDRSGEQIQKLEDLHKGLLFVHGDATRDETIRLAGLSHAAGLIAALPDEKDNLFITVAVKSRFSELGENFRTLAKVSDFEKTAPKIQASGGQAISPALISARRMISEMFRPSVTTFLDRMLKDKRAIMRVEEIPVTPNSSLAGQTLKHARIPQKAGLIVVALKKISSDKFIYNPKPDTALDEGDIIIVVGAMEKILKLRSIA